MSQQFVSFSSAVAICLVAASAPTLAADFPVKAPPLVAPAVYNWTGVYIGVHAGYGQGMKDWLNSSNDILAKGFLGGGQIGVNQQIGNWVIGLEADASFANIKGDQTFRNGVPPGVITQSAGAKIDALTTVTGRLGFAQGRWLVYLKGGGAWAHETHDFAAVNAGVRFFNATANDLRFGGVIGLGSEVALWGNWTVKSEYNYFHFGNKILPFAGTQTNAGVTTPLAFDGDILQSLHVAKLGLNYRFGPDGAPAIAPSPAAPGYNWTGAWIGVQAGYGFGHESWPALAPRDAYSIKGGVAGVSSGASVQAGVFVLGVESEMLWTGIRGGRFDAIPVAPNPVFVDTDELSGRINWLSLNSLRAGFVAADRWQVYAKGGIALAHATHDRVRVTDGGVNDIVSRLSGNSLHTGYLVGVGIEHAFLGNWSAKAEYNYIGFNRQNFLMDGTRIGANFGFDANRQSARSDLQLVKVGINYHFNSIADVITAKY